jgi:putative endonuclease
MLLQQHPEYAHYDCRFDVIAYNTMNELSLKNEPLDNQPEWIQNAFIASAW